MSDIFNIILLPVLAGIVLFAVPERIVRIKGVISILISAVALICSVLLLSEPNTAIVPHIQCPGSAESSSINSILNNLNALSVLHIDNLSKLVVIIISFYAFIISVYSISTSRGKENVNQFYAYLLITLGTSNGAVLSNHLFLFIFFWGALGITLYKLIRGSDEESAAAAKKSLILIGASDCVMIFGIAIIWQMNHSLAISGNHLSTGTPLGVIAFLCLLIGSFTKAGAFPFHTWVPDFAQKAPASSSAYLPASLDKLLGIYFLSRICIDMFKLNHWLVLIMVLLGALTIIIGVMMALVQHNYKRLLGYHAVSQVGYMVLGLGLGTPLGIAGGLFHMINHTMYKSGLFMVAGNIKEKTGNDDIETLGGLSRSMPITFIAAMIFALSISGIPPLNGFASKWLIYQGIIEFGKQPGLANSLWLIWLGLAVIGSALTMASFIKFLSGIFLGRSKVIYKEAKEVGILMWAPVAFLALACIAFGVFASNIIIPGLIMPLYGSFEYAGIWNSSIVGLLVLISILLGIALYLLGNIKKFRTDDSFIGGETQREELNVNVTEFYSTISKARFFSTLYKLAEKKWFDIYDVSKAFVFGTSSILSRAHTGMLPMYAIWLIAGLVLLMILLI